MGRRCKEPEHRRDKTLLLSLNQAEFDRINELTESLGLSKVDLVLNALGRTYSSKELTKDYAYSYLVMLSNQIEEYEERIRKDMEVLTELKTEYRRILNEREGFNESEKTVQH